MGHKTSDHTRDPCPYNIVGDTGIGFTMGAIGGSFWHGFKGYRNSPRGERLSGALSSIKSRAPIIGGNFAVWSGLFNTMDCTISHIREKEDSWNAIWAGASTGAILAGRTGTRGMLVSAIFGGVILGVMEGVGALINRMNSSSYTPVAPVLPSPPQEKQEKQEKLEPVESSNKPQEGSSFNIFKGRFGFGSQTRI